MKAKTKGNGKGKAARKARTEAKAASGGLIPLKRICSEFGIEPKRARVKLRRVWRREENPGVQFHGKNERWDLTAAQAREVRAILQPAS